MRIHIYIFQHQFQRRLQKDVPSTQLSTIYLAQTLSRNQ